VRAVTCSQLADLLHPVLAALSHDVGGAELPTKIGANGVAAHQDDLLGSEALGRQDGQ
jgi:hypothetical protein